MKHLQAMDFLLEVVIRDVAEARVYLQTEGVEVVVVEAVFSALEVDLLGLRLMDCLVVEVDTWDEVKFMVVEAEILEQGMFISKTRRFKKTNKVTQCPFVS